MNIYKNMVCTMSRPKGDSMINPDTPLRELEQRALELMLFVNASKASIKQAKKDIDALLERIEELKKDNV